MNIFVMVLSGIPMTMIITVGAFLLGVVLAIPVMFARISHLGAVQFLGSSLINLMRGIPPLVWLMLLYFGLNGLQLGFRITPVQAGIIGFGVVSAGYLAEIFRGGILAVPRGQFEAATALGLSGRTRFIRIITPQAFSSMLPSLTTYFLSLIKDSSVASMIGVTEMVFQAGKATARNPNSGIMAFFFAGLIYIVLSIPFAYLARRLEGARKVGAK